ncbi:hypothetical protein BaRGS_00020186 [Batillaria attramentaria]|uniref:SH3 domain-containing protein n=1 Tax=Batillaria attramentaria TaxID=370345 RepID=A0ABD0KN91_9CAEN
MLTKPVLVVLLMTCLAFELGDSFIWYCYCVTGQGVRIRRSPSTSSDILGLAYPGDCYWGQSSTNGFLKIEYTGYGGMIAYTASQYWTKGSGCAK